MIKLELEIIILQNYYPTNHIQVGVTSAKPCV